MMITVIEEKSISFEDNAWSTKRIVKEASKYDSVLDIGCGVGTLIKQIKADVRIGVDACPDVINSASKHRNNGVIFQIRDLINPESLSGLSVDCVVGMDIIEHLAMYDALILLERCDKIAKKELLFYIPVGNHPQDKDPRGFNNHYYQTHRSTWYPEDMNDLGYDVWYYPNWYLDAQPPKEKGAMFCQKLITT